MPDLMALRCTWGPALALISRIDYGVIAIFVTVIVTIGIYFSRKQTTSHERLFGPRSLGAAPLGLSLAALIHFGHSLTGLPAIAYERGLVAWLIPATGWLILPIVVFLAIPILRGLAVSSIYEYLELRFDSRVRALAGALFLVWQILWLSVGAVAACDAIALIGEKPASAWLLGPLLVGLAALIVFLGGLPAVIWSGIAEMAATTIGLAVIIGALWGSLEGGPQRVVEVARNLGRLDTARADVSWSSARQLWGSLPAWLVASLTMFIADQGIGQRYLVARSINVARTSYLGGTIALTFVLSGLLYVGLGLLAFFHDHPENLRPDWVVNLDGQIRQPLRDERGRLLLHPRKLSDSVSPENLQRLVREGRVLRPNDKLPFTSADELLDPVSGRVLVEKLAMRRPKNGSRGGELVLRRGVEDQLLPQFAAVRLGSGATGVVTAAILAASVAWLGSGLVALAWVAVNDVSSPLKVQPPDHPRLARRAVPFFALAIAGVCVLMATSQTVENLVTAAALTLGGPLVALFLLGMLTRRATTTAALVAGLAGVGLSIGLVALDHNQVLSANIVWTFGLTFALGHSLSFVLGRRKPNVELRGLVAGCGQLGLRSRDEELPLVGLPD